MSLQFNSEEYSNDRRDQHTHTMVTDIVKTINTGIETQIKGDGLSPALFNIIMD